MTPGCASAPGGHGRCKPRQSGEGRWGRGAGWRSSIEVCQCSGTPCLYLANILSQYRQPTALWHSTRAALHSQGQTRTKSITTSLKKSQPHEHHSKKNSPHAYIQVDFIKTSKRSQYTETRSQPDDGRSCRQATASAAFVVSSRTGRVGADSGQTSSEESLSSRLCTHASHRWALRKWQGAHRLPSSTVSRGSTRPSCESLAGELERPATVANPML